MAPLNTGKKLAFAGVVLAPFCFDDGLHRRGVSEVVVICAAGSRISSEEVTQVRASVRATIGAILATVP